jgi:hypothetical protein
LIAFCHKTFTYFFFFHSIPQSGLKPMAQSISTPGTLEAPQGKRASKLRLIIPLGIVLAGGIAAWYFLSRPPSNALQFSGRIEGYKSNTVRRSPLKALISMFNGAKFLG